MEQRQESETIKEREMRVKGRENGETGQEGIERGERAGLRRGEETRTGGEEGGHSRARQERVGRGLPPNGANPSASSQQP